MWPFDYVHILRNLAATDGSVTYSEIRTFMEKQPTVITTYKTITTSSNNTIRLSGNHLIYARKFPTEQFYPM